jgi:hypothetical protein
MNSCDNKTKVIFILNDCSNYNKADFLFGKVGLVIV